MKSRHCPTGTDYVGRVRARTDGVSSLIISAARLVDGRDGVELRTLGHDDIIMSHGRGRGGSSIPRDLPHSGVRMRNARLIEIAFNGSINQTAVYVADACRTPDMFKCRIPACMRSNVCRLTPVTLK